MTKEILGQSNKSQNENSPDSCIVVFHNKEFIELNPPLLFFFCLLSLLPPSWLHEYLTQSFAASSISLFVASLQFLFLLTVTSKLGNGELSELFLYNITCIWIFKLVVRLKTNKQKLKNVFFHLLVIS